MPTAPNEIVTNLVNLLPTGTFLTFQTLAPLFTNNGNCHFIEKLMTSLLILTFSVVCFTIRFTDSVTTQTGVVYYGMATNKGLYNPQFLTASLPYTQGPFYTGPPGTKQFYLSPFDFVNGFLTVVCFCTLALLTSPVTDCLYGGDVPTLVTKTVPVLVALLVSVYFAFAPPARRGIGFAISNIHTHVLVLDEASTSSLNTAIDDKDARFSKSNSGALLLKA